MNQDIIGIIMEYIGPAYWPQIERVSKTFLYWSKYYVQGQRIKYSKMRRIYWKADLRTAFVEEYFCSNQKINSAYECICKGVYSHIIMFHAHGTTVNFADGKRVYDRRVSTNICNSTILSNNFMCVIHFRDHLLIFFDDSIDILDADQESLRKIREMNTSVFTLDEGAVMYSRNYGICGYRYSNGYLSRTQRILYFKISAGLACDNAGNIYRFDDYDAYV